MRAFFPLAEEFAFSRITMLPRDLYSPMAGKREFRQFRAQAAANRAAIEDSPEKTAAYGCGFTATRTTFL
jgi:hypothetical protein